MSDIFREILRHLFGRAFGDIELILGFPLAFALWCLNDAAVSWKTRRVESVILAMAGLGLITLLLIPDWDAGTLLRIGASGLLMYLPLFWLSRQRRQGGRRVGGK